MTDDTTSTQMSPSRVDEPSPPPRRRIVLWTALAVAVVVVLGGFALWWFFIRSDAPEAVNLEQATQGVQAPTTAAGGQATATTAAGAAAAGPVSGTWKVNPTITNAEGTSSFGGFRVNEVLVGVGAGTATGRSTAVEGTVTVDGSRVTAAQISVDLTSIRSNEGRRNNAIQQALQTSRFPKATFTLTQPISAGSVPAEGQKITVKATGDLTIKGVTKPATIDIDATLQNGVLVLVGSAPVAFADFGITAPTAPVVASVEDRGVMEFQLYLTKA
ncbi:MAG: YceI family protein [Acidimicrobiales bacterium]